MVRYLVLASVIAFILECSSRFSPSLLLCPAAGRPTVWLGLVLGDGIQDEPFWREAAWVTRRALGGHVGPVCSPVFLTPCVRPAEVGILTRASAPCAQTRENCSWRRSW